MIVSYNFRPDNYDDYIVQAGVEAKEIQELETVNDYEDQEIDLPSPEPHYGTYGGDC